MLLHTGASAHEREQILVSLLDLYTRSRNALEKGEFTLHDTHAMAEYVSQVKALLSEWGKAEAAKEYTCGSLSRINDMQSRYDELEGMVKEVRNDLQRAIENMKMERK
jgi:hypothetical protein